MTYGFVRDALSGILGVAEGEITPATKLWGALDVVSYARLVRACEARFRITIPDECAVECARLGDLVRLVAARVSDGTDGARPVDDARREAWYYE